MALPLDAKILSPYSKVKISKMAVGDPVVTWLGTQAKITEITPRKVERLYRVLLSNGKYVDCSADHLWRMVSPISSRFDQTEPTLMNAQIWTMRIYGVSVTTQWIMENLEAGEYMWTVRSVPDRVDGRMWLRFIDAFPLDAEEETIDIKIDHKDNLFVNGDNLVIHGC